MSLAPLSTKGEPIYRLLIPSVQLAILTRFYPTMKVLEAHGKGSIYGTATHQDVQLKGVTIGKVSSQLTGPATLDFVWNQQTGPVTLDEIYNVYAAMGVVDISLHHLTFYRTATMKGSNAALYLRFGKDTVHKQVLEKLVMDGTFPLQETYQLYAQVKKNLKKQGLSPDVLKRYRPSCLVLYDITGHKDMMYDAKQIWSLKLPNMLLIQEVYKKWELYDYEYRVKVGAASTP